MNSICNLVFRPPCHPYASHFTNLLYFSIYSLSTFLISVVWVFFPILKSKAKECNYVLNIALYHSVDPHAWTKCTANNPFQNPQVMTLITWKRETAGKGKKYQLNNNVLIFVAQANTIWLLYIYKYYFIFDWSSMRRHQRLLHLDVGCTLGTTKLSQDIPLTPDAIIQKVL